MFVKELFRLCIFVFHYQVKMQCYDTKTGLRTGYAGPQRFDLVARVSHFHKRYSSIMFIYFLGNALKCDVKSNISLKLNITCFALCCLHWLARVVWLSLIKEKSDLVCVVFIIISSSIIIITVTVEVFGKHSASTGLSLRRENKIKNCSAKKSKQKLNKIGPSAFFWHFHLLIFTLLMCFLNVQRRVNHGQNL